MDGCPKDRLCYVNLNCPNGLRSNRPPMSRQFGPSKWTTVQWTVHVMSIWTVQMDDGPIDRCSFGRSIGPPILWLFGPSKIRVADYHFGPSKKMIVDRNFGPSKYRVSRRPFGRLSFVQMDDMCYYIWMHPNQRYRDVEMNTVQKDSSGMSEWT